MHLNRRPYQALLLIVFMAAALACTPRQEDATLTAQTTILATINDEPMTLADFELSETWLPDFARQLEDNEGLNIHRFWSLVQMILIAQDAKAQNLLDDASRRLAIKEALTTFYLNAQPVPEVNLSQARIDALIHAHPEAFWHPEQYEVSYALVHGETRWRALQIAYGLVSSAQMGYNVFDPPPDDDPHAAKGAPRMQNQKGHHASARFFNFAFVTRANERFGDPCRLGPFTERDGFLFSCPKAVAALAQAPIGRPLPTDISCDPTWRASTSA